MRNSLFEACVLALLPFQAHSARSADLDEFKVKRESIFEFEQKPAVTRNGDKTTIAFEAKSLCDVTVALEHSDGRILRHLACGVLGAKAPEPFLKNSKRQALDWDGKNDQGVYVDDKQSVVVRVSLGLKPQFERTLFWSPKKRLGFSIPMLRAAPEGVYYAESSEHDQVRLFDHQGNYLRTVYPFPAEKADQVQGLQMHTFRQSGLALPLKLGYCQATMLTCKSGHYGAPGITALAAANGRLALTDLKLNRFSSDGSSGGVPFHGPQIGIPVPNVKEKYLAPLSTALTPDGKWLYLTNYHADGGWSYHLRMNGVLRMPYDGSQAPTLFAGELKQDNPNHTSEPGKFRMATSVACDASGRVYVSDYLNDRVQVFSEEGKLLKTLAVPRPARVAVHQKSGDIYVCSWMMIEQRYGESQPEVDATLTHLGPLENPALKLKCPLPLPNYRRSTSWNVPGGFEYQVELDSWTEKPTLWIVNGQCGGMAGHDDGSTTNPVREFDGGCVLGFEEEGGKLVLKHNFVDAVKKSVGRVVPPILWRQRLYVNPVNGKLLVAEGDSGVMKSVNQLVELDPESGKTQFVDLPMGAEDLCFDVNGLIYLRTDTVVARYNPKDWREVPWDYGQEMENHSYGMGARGANLLAGLITPGHRSFNFWHLGGIDISLKGHLVVTTCNGAGVSDVPQWKPGEPRFKYEGKPYRPAVYPGRNLWGEIHVWDKHGKLVCEDAVPGMGHLNGIGIDRDDHLYLHAASRRLIGGKPIDAGLERDASGTLLKVPLKKAQVLSSSNTMVPVPLADNARPARPPELTGFTSGWVEGAEWFYGGVGFSTPGACVCWNTRFDLDYFNRSFAPEPQHCSVAVLDSAGNLILRVGKYGNVDDGKPLIPAGGPAETRSIGGDEVALLYACYVASHTDRRLFIADAGNARILSVKLGYHAEDKVALKDVRDQATK